MTHYIFHLPRCLTRIRLPNETDTHCSFSQPNTLPQKRCLLPKTPQTLTIFVNQISSSASALFGCKIVQPNIRTRQCHRPPSKVVDWAVHPSPSCNARN